MYYLNGVEVQEPKVTPLEAKLMGILSVEDFGDTDNAGLITRSTTEWCVEGGYQRTKLIKWPNRQQLGALLTSLSQKHIIVTEEDDVYGEGLWFDCDLLRALS